MALNYTVNVPFPEIPEPFQDTEEIIASIIAIVMLVIQICNHLGRLLISVLHWVISLTPFGEPPEFISPLILIIVFGLVFNSMLHSAKNLIKWFLIILILLIIISIGYNGFFAK